MQFSTLMTLAAGAALTQAAPLQTRTNYADVVFNGAAGAAYTVSVPLDGSMTSTNNPLSISSVSSTGVNVATECTLYTVDYPPALVEGPANTWVVGPPQTVNSISCKRGSSPRQTPPNSIVIEFQGADPDKGASYQVTVPLDGSSVATNNPLSISTLVSDFASLATNCNFVYIDHSAALAQLSPNKWAVGPPQTILSVACHA